MSACVNVEVCGTKVLEAKSSIALGVCLRCRGYYDTKDRKLQDQIYMQDVAENQSKGEEQPR